MIVEKECIECGLEYKLEMDDEYDVNLCYCPCFGNEDSEDDMDL